MLKRDACGGPSYTVIEHIFVRLLFCATCKFVTKKRFKPFSSPPIIGKGSLEMCPWMWCHQGQWFNGTSEQNHWSSLVVPFMKTIVMKDIWHRQRVVSKEVQRNSWSKSDIQLPFPRMLSPCIDNAANGSWIGSSQKKLKSHALDHLRQSQVLLVAEIQEKCW